MLRVPLRAPALVLMALGAAACGTQHSSGCHPGDQVSCVCNGGVMGFTTCGADGLYGACACSSTGTGGGTTSGTTTTTSSETTDGGTDGGGGDAGDGGDGGLLPFMAPCTTNAMCETMLCVDFPGKGPYCTKMCTMSSDCPSPSSGCNPQGVCKAP